MEGVPGEAASPPSACGGGARAGDSPSGDPQREMIKPDRLFVCLSACDHVHTCRIIQPARILLREEKDHVTQVLTGLNQSEVKNRIIRPFRDVRPRCDDVA